MERIARNQLGAGASQRDINNYVGQLFEVNGISNARGIQPDQTIMLPGASTAAASTGLAAYGRDIAVGEQLSTNKAAMQIRDDLQAQQAYLNRNDGQLRGWVADQIASGRLAAMSPSESMPASEGERKMMLDKNLMKPEGRSAYATDSGYRDTKSGQYSKSPFSDGAKSFNASMESEYVLIGAKTSGPLTSSLPIENGNYIGARQFGDYQAESKVVLTGKNSLIPSSLDAKLSAGARYGIQYAQGAAEGATDVLGANFGAKVEGNVSTSAALNAEGKVSLKPGGRSGVTTDIGLSGTADAAVLRAQGKAEFPIQLGPLTLKPSVQIEGQAVAIGVSGGVGFKTYETRTGGSMYISGGAAALFGAKVKLGLDWGWKN